MQDDDPKAPKMPPVEDSLAGDGPQIDDRTKVLLGHALKAHYDDLVSTPIPDRFLVLLAELEAKEARDE